MSGGDDTGGAAAGSGAEAQRTILATFFVARMRIFRADRLTAERVPTACGATTALWRGGGRRERERQAEAG